MVVPQVAQAGQAEVLRAGPALARQLTGVGAVSSTVAPWQE